MADEKDQVVDVTPEPEEEPFPPEEVPTQALAVAKPSETQLMDIKVLQSQIAVLKDMMSSVLVDGEDYGFIPGIKSKKPALFKSGAEKISMVFRLDPQYTISRCILEEDFILYDIKCVIYSINTGRRLGSGMGSCSSREEKYMWKRAYQTEWNNTAEDRRRKKVIWNKAARREEEVLQVRTNPYEIMNTIEKMAAKRSHVAATLTTTAASFLLTQDLEDMPKEPADEGHDEPQASSGTSSGSAPAGGGEPPKKGTVTEPMVRLIHVLFGKINIKAEAEKHAYMNRVLTEKIGKKFEYAHLSEMKFEEAKLLIDNLQGK